MNDGACGKADVVGLHDLGGGPNGGDDEGGDMAELEEDDGAVSLGHGREGLVQQRAEEVVQATDDGEVERARRKGFAVAPPSAMATPEEEEEEEEEGGEEEDEKLQGKSFHGHAVEFNRSALQLPLCEVIYIIQYDGRLPWFWMDTYDGYGILLLRRCLACELR